MLTRYYRVTGRALVTSASSGGGGGGGTWWRLCCIPSHQHNYQNRTRHTSCIDTRYHLIGRDSSRWLRTLPQRYFSDMPVLRKKEQPAGQQPEQQPVGQLEEKLTVSVDTLKDEIISLPKPPPWKIVSQLAEHCKRNFGSNAEILIKLGVAIVKRYQTKASISSATDLLIDGLKINGTSEEGFSYLGKAFAHGGDRKRSEAAYERAIAINPENIDALIGLGVLYAGEENWKRSIKYFLKAVKQQKENRELLVNLGSAYYALGQHETALKWIEKAKKLDANDTNVYLNLGNIEFHSNNLDKAIEHYSRAAEIDPNCAEAYARMGDVYLNTNDFEKTKLNFDKAIQCNPNEMNYYVRRASLAMAHEEEGTKVAISFLNKASEIDPDHPNVLLQYGTIYATQERYEEASHYFLSCLVVDPNSIEARINLATLYNNMGNPFKAKQVVEEAKTLSGEKNQKFLNLMLDLFNEEIRLRTEKKQFDDE